jgi:hypothetical protein
MRRALLISFCLLLVLPAAPALAKKKHKKPAKLGPVITATATGSTITSGETTVTATCPTGKQAVGGGFSVPINTTDVLFVTSSYRSAPDAWTIVALQQRGSGAATAFAYCRNANKPITDMTATGTVPSGDGTVGDARVGCPAGTQLVSGGVQMHNGATAGDYALPIIDLAINTSPVWLVQAVNNSGGAHTFTVHAYCMAGIAAPRFVTANSSPVLAKDAIGALTSPSCPAPKKPKKGKKKRKKKPAQLLSAGGFGSQVTTPIEVFSDSRIDSNVWLNSGPNVTGPTGNIHLTSQAICV